MNKDMINALILSLLDFQKVFEIECDASNVGICVILNQNSKHITFYCEKLIDSGRKYSVYDKDFYVIVCALGYWYQYLHP